MEEDQVSTCRSKAKSGSESNETATITLVGNPTSFGQSMASSQLSVYLNESQGYYGLQPPTAGTNSARQTSTHHFSSPIEATDTSILSISLNTDNFGT